MNRRNAIKNISYSLGLAIATPTAISLLNSCKTDPDRWIPTFLSPKQGHLVSALSDIIIPETDTPSASQVNVPEFIDTYISEVINPKSKEKLSKGLDLFMNQVLSDAAKKDIYDVSSEEIEKVLAKHLKKPTAEIEKIKKQKSENALIFSSLAELRNLCIFAYKNSAYVGKNVLAYDPVPGGQKGCISTQEATEGKAWSLS